MEELTGERIAELTKKLHQSTSVEEVIERGKPLGMDFSKEEAEQYLEVLMPDEPEKEFIDYMLEIIDAEDEAEKEAITEKMVKNEMRLMLEADQKKKGGEKV